MHVIWGISLLSGSEFAIIFSYFEIVSLPSGVNYRLMPKLHRPEEPGKFHITPNDASARDQLDDSVRIVTCDGTHRNAVVLYGRL